MLKPVLIWSIASVWCGRSSHDWCRKLDGFWSGFTGDYICVSLAFSFLSPPFLIHNVLFYSKWDGTLVYAKNSVLSTQYIYNVRRSGRTGETNGKRDFDDIFYLLVW
jgi:hypothetical protein